MGIIKPDDVAFLFDNKNGTFTVGLKGGGRQILGSDEGKSLSEMMNRRESDEQKIAGATDDANVRKRADDHKRKLLEALRRK